MVILNRKQYLENNRYIIHMHTTNKSNWFEYTAINNVIKHFWARRCMIMHTAHCNIDDANTQHDIEQFLSAFKCPKKSSTFFDWQIWENFLWRINFLWFAFIWSKKASAEIIFVGTVLTSGGSLIERGNLSFVSIPLKKTFSMKGKRGKSVL